MVIGFLLVLRYIRKYKSIVFLLVKTGEGLRLMKDKGWAVFNKRSFKLRKNKTFICPYPHSEHTIMDGKKEVYVGHVKDNSVSWCTVDENSKFVPMDINMMNFMADTLEKIDEATKEKLKFWDKYGHQIMWIASMGIFLVVIILVLNRMDKIIAMYSGSVEGLRQKLEMAIPLLPFIRKDE